jgi:hypothetical protein
MNEFIRIRRFLMRVYRIFRVSFFLTGMGGCTRLPWA